MQQESSHLELYSSRYVKNIEVDAPRPQMGPLMGDRRPYLGVRRDFDGQSVPTWDPSAQGFEERP